MATPLPLLPDVERLSPLVIRILGGNPGKFTLQGTNTYLLGKGASRLLIDTGEGKPSWREHLSSLLASESASISHALLTHWHPDHVGGLGDLRSLYPDAIVHKHPSPRHPIPGIIDSISDDQAFEVDGITLRAFHSPGHTTDHMSFILQEEDAMFTGDNVLGHGTAVFEDLTVYLNSLSRMREQFKGRAYPAHGGVIEDGQGKIDEYTTHRQQREEEILQALGDVVGEATVMEVVKVVYKAVPVELYEPAAGGVVQILRKLEREGKVVEKDGRWRVSGKEALRLG